MSVDVKLVDKSIYSEKMDNLTMAILGLTANQGGQVAIKSWNQVQQIVRMGLAPKFFSIGDILYAEKESAISATCSNGGITVTVNAEVFIEAVGESGTLDYEATYDGVEWHKEDNTPINLATYGITLSGSTPQEGDKIVIHETADSIPFVVVGFDQERPVDTNREHSMSLLMLNTFTGVVFSARQSFFTNRTDSVIPAGTYNFLLGAHSWYASDVGKYFQFTLAQDLPVGGQLVFQQSYDATLVNASVKVFASGSTLDSSPTATITLTEGQGGTYLGTLNNGLALDSAENYQKCFNSCQRALLGSNNWEQSAIRQWCNSKAKKGSVWTPKSPFDRPPSWATTLDGFMHGLDPHLVSAISKVKKTTLLNNVCDGGGNITTEETCWLMAMGEMGVNGFSAEGSQYEWYKQLLGGTIADWSTHTELIKTNSAGSPQYWWLRSPYTGDANISRRVYTSGYVSGDYAYYGLQAVVGFAIA